MLNAYKGHSKRWRKIVFFPIPETSLVYRKISVYLEPSTWRVHVDGGWLKGELRGKDELPVVEASGEGRLLRPGDHVVPLQQVGGQRLRHDVRHRVALQAEVILAEAGHRGVGAARHGQGEVVGGAPEDCPTLPL